jgi:predicted nucleic acid-binding protein
MDAAVVDASALGAIVFNEPEGPALAQRLGGAALVAPGLLLYEIANVCVTKIRRHRHLRDNLFAAFALLERFDIEFVDVDHREVVALADRSGLTAYDASYLWLARRLDAALITLDAELAAAMEGKAGS